MNKDIKEVLAGSQLEYADIKVFPDGYSIIRIKIKGYTHLYSLKTVGSVEKLIEWLQTLETEQDLTD